MLPVIHLSHCTQTKTTSQNPISHHGQGSDAADIPLWPLLNRVVEMLKDLCPTITTRDCEIS